MPAALALGADSADRVTAYVTAMQAAGNRTGRSTVQAASTFCAKLERAGGWEGLDPDAQADAIAKARSFASWLLVTARLTIDAGLLGRVDLRLGNAARTYNPRAHAWFVAACRQLQISDSDIALQWNTLAKIAAVTGIAPDRVRDEAFDTARGALLNTYYARGK